MAKANDIPQGPPPSRRPQSLRRTSSVQSHTYGSFTGPYAMWGYGRDLFTGEDLSGPQVLSEDTLRLGVAEGHRISSISANRCDDVLDKLISLRLGGVLRKTMAEVIPQEVEQSTILHRLLDDTVGASIVTNAAFDAWGLIERDDQIKMFAESGFDNTGLCISYSPGSNALTPSGQANVVDIERIAVEVPLYGGDPQAWHQWEKPEGPNQLRMRRMDLWEEEGLLHVDVGFQDSAAFQDKEERLVFHEYRLKAVIEPGTFILQSVDVENGVLPFNECLQAPATAQNMVGQSLLNFRRSVPAQLPGVAGCTHLNDVLRSLQDVVAMSDLLRHHSEKA